MHTLLRYLLVLFCASVLFACTNLNLKELDDVQYSPSLVLPIGTFSATIDQFTSYIDSTYIKVDDDAKMFYFEWDMPKDTMMAVDLSQYAQGDRLDAHFAVKDIDAIGEIIALLPGDDAILPEGDYTYSYSDFYPFGFNEKVEGEKEYRIDSCYFRTATLDFDINVSGFEVSEENYIDVDILFPDLIVDGSPLRMRNKITTPEGKITDVFTNFPVYFGADNTENLQEIKVDITFHSAGEAGINRAAAVNFGTKFEFIGIDHVYGYFYNREPLFEDHAVVSLPENSIFDRFFEDNRLLIRDPQIYFNLYSNVGIPINLHIDNLSAEDKNGNKVSANFDGSTTKVIDLTLPVLNDDRTTVPSETNVLLNREHGETNKLFTIFPQTISYQWSAYSNDDTPDDVHFLFGDPFIAIDAKAVLPLVLDAGSILNFDTVIDADLTNLIPYEEITIENLNLYLDIANMMPFALDVSLVCLGENGEVVYQGSNVTLNAAVVDDEGRAVSPSNQSIEIRCKDESISNILKTKSIGLKLAITGRDAESGIYIQTTNDIKMSISAFVKLNADINLNEINSGSNNIIE